MVFDTLAINLKGDKEQRAELSGFGSTQGQWWSAPTAGLSWWDHGHQDSQSSIRHASLRSNGGQMSSKEWKTFYSNL